MLRGFILFILMAFLCTPVSAAKIEWSQTAQDFLDKYKVEVVFFSDDLIANAIEHSNCIECRSFDKTHNIDAYKEHLYNMRQWIEFDDRYTYTKNYVGYDVFRIHIANYKKDEKYIMTQVYVNPTFYRTQTDLINDANSRKQRLDVARSHLAEHVLHIQNEFAKYLK